jgi:light-harvesting complex I chlorophyll a/b binding protein 1
VNHASRSSALNAAELDGMLGVGPETGGKIFDPLNLNEFVPADYAREAELSNGRSAMLATVGWVFPKAFGTFDSTDVTTTDPIKAIMEADPQWWAQFIVFCGVIEAYKYRQALDGKSYCGPGEPAVDYLKMYPSGEKARNDMHMKELKNGRLAMIGVAGFLANYFIPGAVPGMPAGY